jgi:Flp pilus assembly protein TadG
MNKVTRFLSNSSGNTTIMFAIAIVPMLLVAGAATDMVRANRTQALLQGAADAAALAGGVGGQADDDDSDDAMQEIVEDFVEANSAKAALIAAPTIITEYDEDSGAFKVRLKGKFKTSFMALAGIPTMEIDAVAEVMVGNKALEVALVLDNTASMNAEGRLDDLKVAAKKLVDDIYDDQPDDAYVKVGIVPFSNYVNVGTGARGENWLEVPPDQSSTVDSCWDTFPQATKSNCQMVPYTLMNDGVQTSGTTEQCVWDYGPPTEVCGPVTSTTTWFGCVGSRNSPLDRNVGSEDVPYPGVVNQSCPAEVTDLTDDESKLKGEIDSMIGTGETYIPAGLIWGWNMLTAAEPLSNAKSSSDMSGLGGVKALVLMTDGASTLVPAYPYHVAGPAATADAIMLDICSNIKGDGITIYTVGFKVADSIAQNNLIACASDPSKAFDADNASELSAAFKEIAQKLSEVRLSQ